MGLTLIEHAKAVLYNGLGRYREACEAARRGAAHPRELAISNWSLPHLVEAAVRTDQRALAEDAMRRLARTTAPSGTDWALGVESRCRALVSDGDEAEGYYRDAIDHLGRTRLRAEHARGHLLYGEWLRRQAHHVEARTHLRTAHDMFGDMGMEAFTKRARRERLATGESIRKRRAERRDAMTPQEAQIAQLARAGLTNPEIGGQLFLSPRTVEWHLKKILRPSHSTTIRTTGSPQPPHWLSTRTFPRRPRGCSAPPRRRNSVRCMRRRDVRHAVVRTTSCQTRGRRHGAPARGGDGRDRNPPCDRRSQCQLTDMATLRSRREVERCHWTLLATARTSSAPIPARRLIGIWCGHRLCPHRYGCLLLSIFFGSCTRVVAMRPHGCAVDRGGHRPSLVGSLISTWPAGRQPAAER
jgi:DNA-binding CsgD family transcriptional regulator